MTLAAGLRLYQSGQIRVQADALTNRIFYLYGWTGLIFHRRILMAASGQNDSTNYYNRSQRQNLSSFFHNFLHLCLFLV